MKRIWNWLKRERYIEYDQGGPLTLRVSGSAFGWMLMLAVALVLLAI